MNAQLIECIVQILSGLVVLIPLVIKLIEYVKKATKEKNWNQLLKLVIELMETAEGKFTDGATKKEWVLQMIQASSDTINYDIDIEEVGKLIDSLCDMSNIVNAPTK